MKQSQHRSQSNTPNILELKLDELNAEKELIQALIPDMSQDYQKHFLRKLKNNDYLLTIITNKLIQIKQDNEFINNIMSEPSPDTPTSPTTYYLNQPISIQPTENPNEFIAHNLSSNNKWTLSKAELRYYTPVCNQTELSTLINECDSRLALTLSIPNLSPHLITRINNLRTKLASFIIKHNL